MNRLILSHVRWNTSWTTDQSQWHLKILVTWNHIILMKNPKGLPPGIFNDSDNYVRRRWRQIQYLANLFSVGWQREYIPLLQKWQKWLQPKKNVSISDVVLVVDNLPRNSWMLGRVTYVHRDRHGLVRVVNIQTKIGSRYFSEGYNRVTIYKISRWTF